MVFGADADVVWHDRARLHTPLPLGDDGLSRQHQQLAEQALAELDRSPPLVQTLRGLLRVRPGRPPPPGGGVGAPPGGVAWGLLVSRLQP